MRARAQCAAHVRMRVRARERQTQKLPKRTLQSYDKALHTLVAYRRDASDRLFDPASLAPVTHAPTAADRTDVPIDIDMGRREPCSEL